MKAVKKNWYNIVSIIALLIFLTIAMELLQKDVFNIDSTVYNFLVSIRNPILNNFFKFITIFANRNPIIIITVILCLVIFKDNKERFYIVLNVLLVPLINVILKSIFARERPNILRLINETGYSFPSGHAMLSTAFYGLLIYFSYKKIKTPWLRNTACIGLSLLIILIMISRIYVGVHYTTDVIAGCCLSLFYLAIFIKVMNACK